MYLTAGSNVFALEPETGRQIWRFEAPGVGQPARRRLLAGRRADAGPALHRRRRSPDRPRREDRAAWCPSSATHGLVELKPGITGDVEGRTSLVSPPIVYRDVAHHRRQQRRAGAEPRPLRRHPRLGRAHRQAAEVDLPHRAAGRRAGRRDVGRRQLEEPLRHQHVVVLHRRRRARPASTRRSGRRPPTTTAAIARGRTSTATRSSRSTRHRRAEVAPAARPPRPVGLRPAGRAHAHRRAPRRPDHSGGGRDDQDDAALHLRPRDRRADLRHRGAAGAEEHRARRGRRGRRSRFRSSRRRSAASTSTRRRTSTP